MSIELALLIGLWFHFLGDYVLQSDWMAQHKTKRLDAAIVHGAVYTTPFVLITTDFGAMFIIFITHLIIDHWRLARYICWAKNFLAPKWIPYTEASGIVIYHKAEARLNGSDIRYARNYIWKSCKGTGYYERNPPWLSTWLMIIVDNWLHVTFNSLAIFAFYR